MRGVYGCCRWGSGCRRGCCCRAEWRVPRSRARRGLETSLAECSTAARGTKAQPTRFGHGAISSRAATAIAHGRAIGASPSAGVIPPFRQPRDALVSRALTWAWTPTLASPRSLRAGRRLPLTRGPVAPRQTPKRRPGVAYETWEGHSRRCEGFALAEPQALWAVGKPTGPGAGACLSRHENASRRVRPGPGLRSGDPG